MDIHVRIKFECHKQEVEKFSEGRYMVYILSEESEADAMDEALALLSKKLGVPLSQFELKQDRGKDKIFVI